MAQINSINPDGSGNYQAILNDGTTVTYGPTKDPRYPGCWFVSIGESRNHTTYIIEASHDDYVMREVSSRGSDKDAWRTLAVAILS